MSDKIRPEHREKLAVVYVRQSTATQVRHNHESRRLQYALKEKVGQMGWPASRIEVIDDDLGVTASGAARRPGFEHLMTQVISGAVGLVAAREVTRLARNDLDWQRLLEMCRWTGTMVLDGETIYDTRLSDDRLILGVKGSVGAYELDVIRARSLDARMLKAERGEYIIHAPVGFVKTGDDRLEMDPDRRVQGAIRLVFEKFLELGSVRQTYHWFCGHGVKLPKRGIDRAAAGRRAEWQPAKYPALYQMLTNPVYAGCYAYGRRVVKREMRDGRLHQRTTLTHDMKAWRHFLPDHHAGYIDVATFMKIKGMLANNSQSGAHQQGAGGAAKRGPALFSGLVRCGRCGRKMNVAYSGKDRCYRYFCRRFGELESERCTTFNGTDMEAVLCAAALRVAETVSVDAAARAFIEYGGHYRETMNTFARELEQAEFEAERMRRQYDAVEPENRLVAGELEGRWNRALEQVQAARRRLEEREEQYRPLHYSLDDFHAMGRALPEIWNAPETDVRLKKRILRLLIEDVVVDAREKGRLRLTIHWRGGAHTEESVTRIPTGHHRCDTPNSTAEAIRELSVILDDDRLAKYLNESGLKTGRGHAWSLEAVRKLRQARKIPCHCRRRKAEAGWLTLTEAAAFVGISRDALRAAALHGEVAYRHPLPAGPYLFQRKDLEGQCGDLLRRSVARRKTQKSPKNKTNGGLFDF